MRSKYVFRAVMDLSMKIRLLRKKQRMTQTQFGELFSVTQATISRWEEGAEPGHENLKALSTLAGVTMDEFVGYNPPKHIDVRAVNVVGAVEAGAWIEAIEWSEDKIYPVYALPDSKFGRLPHFGLEVRGPSMNEVYPEGSVVICVTLGDAAREPKSGERVICLRRRPNSMIEATVKEFIVEKDGTGWLWPRSKHPAHQAPMPYPAVDGDSEEVWIYALVAGSYRPEP